MNESELIMIDDLDVLVRLVADTPRLCLRYSQGPEADAAGPSRDYEADIDLPGLSVTTLAPEPWWPREPNEWIARRVCKSLNMTRGPATRRPWVLLGTTIGHGLDHEPLVTEVEPVAWVSARAVDQARDLYENALAMRQD